MWIKIRGFSERERELDLDLEGTSGANVEEGTERKEKSGTH